MKYDVFPHKWSMDVFLLFHFQNYKTYIEGMLIISYIFIHIGFYIGIMQMLSHALTHWGQVTHICIGKLTIIGSDNGLSPGRRRAIIWTDAGILLIWPLGTNFSEILIAIEAFSFKKMHLKISSAKWRPFCLGLNVLIKKMFNHHQANDIIHSFIFCPITLIFQGSKIKTSKITEVLNDIP